MPTVGHLDGVGRTDPDAFGVGAGAVTAHHLGAWFFSLLATVSAVRSASRSIGLLVTMSSTRVPYTCPRRIAKLSMPRTVTSPISGSVMARTARNRVSLPTATPRRVASRVPAHPATANPIAVIIAPSTGVRRDHEWVRPGICSAKVFAVQSMVLQKNRRTRRSIMTGCPPIAVSANCRRYRECTRADSPSQRGHRPRSPFGSAVMRIVEPTRRTPATTTPTRWGSNARTASKSHADDPHPPQVSAPWRHAQDLHEKCARSIFSERRHLRVVAS